MDRPKIFIDGKGGVVGAKIYELLSKRDDLEIGRASCRERV